MGITKTLKTKLAQQQGYQPLDNAGQQEVQQQPQRRVSLQAGTTLAEKHQIGILKGAFMVFLLGLVFWSSLANITVSALMREWPNETGNPRVSPVLNISVSVLGALTAFLGALWMWRRQSCAIFLAFLTFALLTTLYLISSGVLLGYTFSGKLRDCPHEYSVYAYHSFHRGWTFTCEKFNVGMYTLAVSSLAFDVIGFQALVVLLVLALRHQIPYAIALLEEKNKVERGYTIVDVESASA